MGKYYEAKFMCDIETENMIKELASKMNKNKSQVVREAIKYYYCVIRSGKKI